MTDEHKTHTTHEGPPWTVKYTLWEKSDDACADREGGHTGEQRTDTAFVWDEPTQIDAVNSLLYDMRGTKSQWELAYIDEVKPAEEDNEQ